ncbi:MAG: hypothetical protein LQ351_000425 [Letrouitia transgressa]|nr:MAG: hypothetical protein LQ351_000425 [Letrouitia transgressa]
MFTDVVNRHQPQEFPQQAFFSHRSGITDIALDSALAGFSRFGHYAPLPHSTRGLRQQRSHQQPYTASKPLVSPSQQRSQRHYATKYDASEHMLRRKTPNGTLSAGYDGRPVEWYAKTPAIRQFLTPTPITEPNVSLRVKPTRDPAHVAKSYKDSSSANWAAEQQHSRWPGSDPFSQVLTSQDGVSGNGERSAFAWRENQNPIAGVDSVLFQGSSPHFYSQLASNHLPTVMQPMWPPCLGPTSLNEPGPCGPYWPDGAYVPYRPAPQQDMRYRNDYTANFQPYTNNQSSSFYDQSDQLSSEASAHYAHWNMHSSQHHLNSAQLNASDEVLAYQRNENAGHSSKHSRPDAEYTYPANFGYGASLSSRERKGTQHHKPWPNTAVSSNLTSDTVPAITMAEQGTNARNVQFKERVLIWAHRVYNCLLSSRQQCYKTPTALHRHTFRHLSSNIYPKPPQQPANTISSTQEPRDSIVKFPSAHPSTNDYDYLSSHRLAHFGKHAAFKSFGDSSIGHREHYHAVYNGVPTASLPLGDNRIVGPQVNSHVLPNQECSPTAAAVTAMEMLSRFCQESNWEWTDGLLLGGCLAYGLGDYNKALKWYSKVLSYDPNNVEAISNSAATLVSLGRREAAEQYWLRSIKLRPGYFEAVEHLVGLYCEDRRGKEAVQIIDFVERSLRDVRFVGGPIDQNCISPSDTSLSPSISSFCSSDLATSEVESSGSQTRHKYRRSTFGSNRNGYTIPSSENGRLISLIHGKGNMLYSLGDNAGAAKAFEEAILIGSGERAFGIQGLIRRILGIFSHQPFCDRRPSHTGDAIDEPILLAPETALETAQLVFPPRGDLPGLEDVASGVSKRAAVSIISNSLLSLAKIYQDGMSSSGATAAGPRATSGVQDILALYYLSLSLQPSPSTANNVGILLASVQQSARSRRSLGSMKQQMPAIPGVAPGSGIALALAYYNYGLNLDSRHAHLYTNLGSLFKDIGQLNVAIKMYEKAVSCDGTFDIALANLANAVKDQGKIGDAIEYYRRAVASNPDFAEAVCGLANALNSVCSWSGRGGVTNLGHKRDRWHVDEDGMLYVGGSRSNADRGWIDGVVSIVDKQLREGEDWGRGVLDTINVESLVGQLCLSKNKPDDADQQSMSLRRVLQDWIDKPWEGAKVVRLIERATKRRGWLLYQRKYVQQKPSQNFNRSRPQLPAALAVPSAPTVLPFHTFTCPLSAVHIRKISQRNGLRISCSTLRAAWLPAHIYEPPPPPKPQLIVGYVSSDFNNHPLAHLMQSVFGFHDKKRIHAICYATTAGDSSAHRQQIEREAPAFHDASSWSIDRLVGQIVRDGCHVLVNLNGYTRGARNEVFAARPAPVQMSFMGFAGTLGAEWCDYLLADEIAIPSQTLRPWRGNVDVIDQTRDRNHDDEQNTWIYGENIIFTKDTFFCCDHRQSAPDAGEDQLSWPEEQTRRWRMRKELFPDLRDDVVILGNFNQLYKIEPTTFRTWLRILDRIPNAVLWLLRFPELGEANLKKTAKQWGGDGVASRIIFTDVAPKQQHISRARVCDLFLDTPECNAHTTAADVLWSGTPLLTFPRYEFKMCSRMAASILVGALPKTPEGDRAKKDLIVDSDEDYEERAIELGTDLVYPTRGEPLGKGKGRLVELRKLLYESRWSSALFDTRRWVRDLENAYELAWNKWVAGEGGDIWL